MEFGGLLLRNVRYEGLSTPSRGIQVGPFNWIFRDIPGYLQTEVGEFGLLLWVKAFCLSPYPCSSQDVVQKVRVCLDGEPLVTGHELHPFPPPDWIEPYGFWVIAHMVGPVDPYLPYRACMPDLKQPADACFPPMFIPENSKVTIQFAGRPWDSVFHINAVMARFYKADLDKELASGNAFTGPIV